MYSTGFYINDYGMQEYSKFIASLIVPNAGAAVRQTSGFPMKGYYVPVQVIVTEIQLRILKIEITSLGYSTQFDLFLSRHHSPDKIMHNLQVKIDAAVLQIIVDHQLDQDQIHREHHPLKNMFKFNT